MQTEATEATQLTPEQQEAQDQSDFEAAFNGETTIEDDASGTEEAGTEGTEGGDALSGAAADTNQEDNSADNIEKEIAGLSPEAVAMLESRFVNTVEEKFSGRLRNLEGNLGGIKQKLDSMATAKAAADETGVAAPNSQQMSEAAKSGPAMARLKEDFPEWAEALEEVQSMAKPNINMDELNGKLQAAEDRASSTAEELTTIKEMRKLDKKHPDWEDIVESDAFSNWLATQPTETQHKAQSSNSAADAIAILNDFKATTSAPDLAPNSGKSTKRLDDAVAPTSGGEPIRKGRKTEHEEFLAAFNS
ncbi:hypothetical protein HBA55_29680 [Pseudomaricurvus alkylphenolicus]|uniref:hypothetical protein n=1 Tax=Pseudomaricurvus alkylphenolicus TaxID=1306991 RepID=UPI001423134F|nr:hypothetical protein [Pseudomaricurvus alkylphenolicus]NIB43810.1 hypothetical protein [Pseudomaricurvus alkylphenolicus]